MKPGVRRSRSEPLSSVISDLLGFSGRRILRDLAPGHDGCERVSPKVEQRRVRKIIRKLRDLRYKVELSADTLIPAPG